MNAICKLDTSYNMELRSVVDIRDLLLHEAAGYASFWFLRNYIFTKMFSQSECFELTPLRLLAIAQPVRLRRCENRCVEAAKASYEEPPPMPSGNKLKSWLSKKLKRAPPAPPAVMENRRPVVVYFSVQTTAIESDGWLIDVSSRALNINSMSLPLMPDVGRANQPRFAKTNVGNHCTYICYIHIPL